MCEQDYSSPSMKLCHLGSGSVVRGSRDLRMTGSVVFHCRHHQNITRLIPAAAVHPVVMSLSEKPSAVCLSLSPSESREPVKHLKSNHCPRDFI